MKCQLIESATLRHVFAVACAVACALAIAQEKPAAAPAPAAGSIDFVEGDAMVESTDGRARIPKVGDPVYESETLTTFAGGEVHMRMADGAYYSLRENTKIRIAAYVANGGDGDRSLIELTKGTIRAVTGWIGRYRRAAYQIRTPIVTIGVRGTDHEPTHIPSGDPRGDPGSYDKVNEGRSYMQSQFGSSEVAANQAAHFSPERRAPPRVLASVPAFFKPSRNEQRFQERARESVRTLDTQREARREAFRNTRKPGAAPTPRPPSSPKPAVSKAERMQQKTERAAKKEARIERKTERMEKRSAAPGPAPRQATERVRPSRPARQDEHFERKKGKR